MLPHKTRKLAIFREQGLKFKQITCPKCPSLLSIALADYEEKENKNIQCSQAQPNK